MKNYLAFTFLLWGPSTLAAPITQTGPAPKWVSIDLTYPIPAPAYPPPKPPKGELNKLGPKWFIDYIKKHEGGGYAKHSSKYGGETNQGVTLSTFQYVNKLRGYGWTYDDFIEMPDQVWNGVYNYIHRSSGIGRVTNPRLRYMLMDFAWSSGPETMRRSVVNNLILVGYSELTLDSSWETILAALEDNEDYLIWAVRHDRLIIARALGEFSEGWLIRLKNFEALLNERT